MYITLVLHLKLLMQRRIQAGWTPITYILDYENFLSTTASSIYHICLTDTTKLYMDEIQNWVILD
jgi:hypothetical protein